MGRSSKCTVDDPGITMDRQVCRLEYLYSACRVVNFLSRVRRSWHHDGLVSLGIGMLRRTGHLLCKEFLSAEYSFAIITRLYQNSNVCYSVGFFNPTIALSFDCGR